MSDNMLSTWYLGLHFPFWDYQPLELLLEVHLQIHGAQWPIDFVTPGNIALVQLKLVDKHLTTRLGCLYGV